MAIAIGIVLAAAVALLARLAGFERGTFYATVLIVVASFYVLFAAIAGGGAGLGLELLVAALFAAGAVLGFRTSQWILAAGLAAHGLFDLVRGEVMSGTGVPPWWPGFCLAYDLTAAALLAAILLTDRPRPAPAPSP